MSLGTDHILVVCDLDPIRLQYQTRTTSDEEFAEFLGKQSRSLHEAADLLQRGEGAGQAVTIAHANPRATLTSSQRQMQAEWLRSHSELLRVTCVATYIVVPHALRRAVMTAVLWLVSPSTEVHACASLEEASNKAVVRAHRAGLQLPKELLGGFPGLAMGKALGRHLRDCQL